MAQTTFKLICILAIASSIIAFDEKTCGKNCIFCLDGVCQACYKSFPKDSGCNGSGTEIANCLVNVSNGCAVCMFGYAAKTNVNNSITECKKISGIKNCEIATIEGDKFICTGCKNNKYPKNGTCVDVEDSNKVAHCKIYNGSQTCETCSNGYAMDKKTDTTCVKNSDGCAIYAGKTLMSTPNDVRLVDGGDDRRYHEHRAPEHTSRKKMAPEVKPTCAACNFLDGYYAKEGTRAGQVCAASSLLEMISVVFLIINAAAFF
jgi:hypothetical protein